VQEDNSGKIIIAVVTTMIVVGLVARYGIGGANATAAQTLVGWAIFGLIILFAALFHK
jgi:hypothetical protein